MINTLDYKKIITDVFVYAVVVAVFVGGIVFVKREKDKQKEVETKNSASRMTTICPALLSISRSSRDTLIVMKAEPLCNTYVMENLK